MSENRFDFYKPWRIKNLPSGIRSELESAYGDYFVPGATYVGTIHDGVGVFEVPHCPYCGTGSFKTNRCKHLVCMYDMNKGEYLEVDPNFRIHVKSIVDGLALTNAAAGNESIEEAFSDLQDGRFPDMFLLADFIRGFSFHQISDDQESHGLGCGYADDHLLLECSSIPWPPDIHD